MCSPKLLSVVLCAAIMLVALPGTGTLWADDDQAAWREVRAILASRCYACHGPDEAAREADLRLDDRSVAVADRDGVVAIVPGDAAASELHRRVVTDDPDLLMPPPDSGPRLTREEAELIRDWIDAGAKYMRHWSFVKPERGEIPAVTGRDRVRHPIDAFVLSQLEARGMTLSAEADRYTLIRRLSLDLTGLPPTPEEADQFVNDQSRTAYDDLVERLLRSPRFGEHWASMWLDLARYADTKGYEKDQPRKIWRYRDWVIDAFNADMPYDQFTIEQLAGDLLPDSTMSQQLATAFHRNTMSNDEGGTDNEEFRIAAVKDRVDTTVQVWMGLTMGCAKCHSHKYDPITQREYYQFMACFNQTEDADRPDDAPRLPTPTTAQQTRIAELEKRIAAVRSLYEQDTPEFRSARDAWVSEMATKQVWSPVPPGKMTSAAGASLKSGENGIVSVSGKSPPKDTYTLVLPATQPVTAIRLEALTDKSLARGGPGRNRRDPNFVLSELTVSVRHAEGEPEHLKLQNARADFSQANWPVAAAVDGRTETGWAIAPQIGKPHVAIFELAEPLAAGEQRELLVSLSQQYGNGLVLGRFRLSVTAGVPTTLQPVPATLGELAAQPSGARTAAGNRQLDEAFRRVYPPTAPLAMELDGLRKEREAVNAEITSTPVMRELPPNRQRATHIHVRGNFLQKGDEVQPGVPATFRSPDLDAPRNRLDVARWLLDAENPLAARVAVNRVWARLFGRGIVQTEEDFGTQGMGPSHPELLDWLAIEYRETHKWSLKELCRAIVTSSVYRQSSVVTDEARIADPENVLLGRGARYRLPAEAIRDQSLRVAGLLVDKVGGPSVMPAQPPGIWQTTYSSLKWKTSDGDGRYRRGLYTFWRRTSPYPSMLTFDAGSREVCVIRRVRTNTPLQALVTMNDPVFVEAAGALAQRILREAGADAGARAERGFRLAATRHPSAMETERLVRLYNSAVADFGAEPEAAARLVTTAGGQQDAAEDVAETAAWTVVASVLLNLDEVLVRY